MPRSEGVIPLPRFPCLHVTQCQSIHAGSFPPSCKLWFSQGLAGWALLTKFTVDKSDSCLTSSVRAPASIRDERTLVRETGGSFEMNKTITVLRNEVYTSGICFHCFTTLQPAANRKPKPLTLTQAHVMCFTSL